MSPAEVTVLCIVGKGRSGSTLLDTMVGQLNGVCSTGELRRLWTWGILGGYRCGCGARVPECAFWSAVLERLRQRWGGIDPDVLARRVAVLQDAVLRWSNVPRLLRQPPGQATGWPALEAYARHLGALYRAIAAETGAEVVVDSTKWPAAPTPLGLVPGVDVRVIHLVRDPRGVSHSWQRRKAWRDRPGGREMPRYGPVSSVASWWARNLVAEAVVRRLPPGAALRLRYEDLVREPRRALQRVAGLLGRGLDGLTFDGDRTVRLRTTHTVGGNPRRLDAGSTEIREDSEWRRSQPATDRLVVGTLTVPLRWRYGYGASGAPSGSSRTG